MDEQKEKMSETLSDAEKEEAVREFEQAKQIHDEMEELAKVFQEELDQTKKEAEEHPESILSAPKAEAEAEAEASVADESSEIPEEELCECCGTKRRGTEKNPDSAYCEECETGLRHYPFDILNVILVLAALALVFYGGFVFANHTPTYASVLKADKLASENKLYSALDTYTAAANSMLNDHINGELVIKRELMTVYKLGGMNMMPENAKKIRAFEFNLPHFKALKVSLDEAVNYMAAAAASNEILSPYETVKPEDIPYDKIIADLDALRTQTPPAPDAESEDDTSYLPVAKQYHPAMISFYQYYTALLAGKDVDTQLQFAEKIREQAPEALWLYGSLLGDLYAKSGKDVEVLCKEMEALNVEDDTPNLLRTSSKRISGDFDGSIALAEESIQAGSPMAAEFLRQQALCYLAKEDFASAFQKAQAAFELSYQGASPSVQLCDTVALCALAAGDTKEYETIVKIFADSGMTVSQEVSEYKDGTRTLQQILTEGDCDL